MACASQGSISVMFLRIAPGCLSARPTTTLKSEGQAPARKPHPHACQPKLESHDNAMQLNTGRAQRPKQILGESTPGW